MALSNEDAKAMIESALELSGIIGRAATATAVELIENGDVHTARAFLTFARLIEQHAALTKRMLDATAN
jgi:hypothetical protein